MTNRTIAATVPGRTNSRPISSLLAGATLAAGLMLLPNYAFPQEKNQKPAATQPQENKLKKVIIGKGDVLTSRSGKNTFQIRITGVNKKDLEFIAIARCMETRDEGGNRKEYVKEARLETSVEYGQEWSWGGAELRAEGKGNGTAMLSMNCEESCPVLKKANGKKAPGKRKKVKEGSI